MWRGQISFETPMLWSIGFLVTFLLGGLTGVLLGSPAAGLPLSTTRTSWSRTSTTCCSARSCSRSSPASTSGSPRCSAGCYWTSGWASCTSGCTFIGFHLTFLVQHWLGAEGMPRRYGDYLPSDGFTTLNTISTMGSFLLGISTLPFLYNVLKSYKYGEVVDRGRPLGPRQLAGVGHVLPAAAAQLHGHAADPLGAAGVRGALPGAGRPIGAGGTLGKRAGRGRQRRRRRGRPASGRQGPRSELIRRSVTPLGLCHLWWVADTVA